LKRRGSWIGSHKSPLREDANKRERERRERAREREGKKERKRE
jgi:hypothetical protein